MKHFQLWLATTPIGVWLSKAVAARFDPWIYKKTGGRLTTSGPVVVPQLVLTTRGRKSGEQRDAQLAYTEVDGAVYVVASNFGGEHHPAWSYNLQANPEAVMHLGDQATPVYAARLSDDAKEVVWERLCLNIPNYAKYRAKTERNIQVYRLDPRSDASAA
ncbi:MAG: nitroreductase/quinone reductase family protein [Myxococcota bacterium]